MEEWLIYSIHTCENKMLSAKVYIEELPGSNFYKYMLHCAYNWSLCEVYNISYLWTFSLSCCSGLVSFLIPLIFFLIFLIFLCASNVYAAWRFVFHRLFPTKVEILYWFALLLWRVTCLGSLLLTLISDSDSEVCLKSGVGSSKMTPFCFLRFLAFCFSVPFRVLTEIITMFLWVMNTSYMYLG